MWEEIPTAPKDKHPEAPKIENPTEVVKKKIQKERVLTEWEKEEKEKYHGMNPRMADTILMDIFEKVKEKPELFEKYKQSIIKELVVLKIRSGVNEDDFQKDVDKIRSVSDPEGVKNIIEELSEKYQI